VVEHTSSEKKGVQIGLSARNIVNGKSKWEHDAAEHNAKQRQFKVLLDRVREWGKIYS
jgi:hypothetical protein